jgi:hypothetical protein
MVERAKPKGQTGPIKLSDTGFKWEIIDFPAGERAREQMIAEIFVHVANNRIDLESPEPRYAPFKDPKQNPENDIDFTILTGQGVKLMELTEFAPLKEHGPKHTDAPHQLQPSAKNELLHALVETKSNRQGAAGRFLVVYTTEEGFWIDAATSELVRRALKSQPPKFDRVYSLTLLGQKSGVVEEIFPGRTKPAFENITTEQLRQAQTNIVHPSDIARIERAPGSRIERISKPSSYKF